jgi:hypothetical protein
MEVKMKKLLGLFVACIMIIVLIGFDKQQSFNLKAVKINVKDNILRYDVILKTDDGTPIKSRFDYPGQRIHGFELAVVPNKRLANLMELDGNQESRFTKMRPNKIGTRSSSRDEEIHLFCEYIIKNDSDLVKVKEFAKDEATIFIFDGANKIIEQPISRQ